MANLNTAFAGYLRRHDNHQFIQSDYCEFVLGPAHRDRVVTYFGEYPPSNADANQQYANPTSQHVLMYLPPLRFEWVDIVPRSPQEASGLVDRVFLQNTILANGQAAFASVDRLADRLVALSNVGTIHPLVYVAGSLMNPMWRAFHSRRFTNEQLVSRRFGIFTYLCDHVPVLAMIGW